MNGVFRKFTYRSMGIGIGSIISASNIHNISISPKYTYDVYVGVYNVSLNSKYEKKTDYCKLCIVSIFKGGIYGLVWPLSSTKIICDILKKHKHMEHFIPLSKYDIWPRR